MDRKLPRILSVGIAGPTTLSVTWDDRPSDDVVDLSGWIGDESEIIAPLRDPDLFRTARVSEYGDAIEWGDQDGDLAIDAYHLRRIAEAQDPLRPERPRKAVRA